MAKRRRFARLLILAVLIVVIAAAVLSIVPLSPLQPAVESRLSEVLGRKVDVDTVRLNLMGNPSLTVGGMTAQEDPAFGDGPFLKADEARADLDLMGSLRNRRLVIRAVTIKSPLVRFVKAADGAWSWTTLGRRASSQLPDVTRVSMLPRVSLSLLLSLTAGDLTGAVQRIKVENASVSLIDRTAPERETLYKNVFLEASFLPGLNQDREKGFKATGELAVQSDEAAEAELLKATLPFDIEIERQPAGGLLISGTVGPGPLEARNVTIGGLLLSGEVQANQRAPMNGNGRITATDMFIRTVNLGERVAGALRVNEIGDMSPGTQIASLETQFQIAPGAVTTSDLRIQQLDGLGDATASRGDFKLESALTVNYTTTILLSDHATRQVKAASPLLGILATILETNNRLSVPLNINGDIRNPQVQVDVSRIF